MVALAESVTCRRRVLLNYFGDRLEQDCGNCDVCQDPPAQFDATEVARKALSCVYRVGQRFGIVHVVAVLRGADNERIRALGHDRLSTYGIGSDRSEQEWTSILRQLIHHGLLIQDIANYSVLKLTDAARPLLRGETSLQLARPRIREQAQKKRPKAAAAQGPYDETLFDELRNLRKQLADTQGVPPYIVFGDATLVQMARDKPMDEQELLAITGVGQQTGKVRPRLPRCHHRILCRQRGCQHAIGPAAARHLACLPRGPGSRRHRHPPRPAAAGSGETVAATDASRATGGAGTITCHAQI
jgi:ATP-dependent DNA helicase RecQ